MQGVNAKSLHGIDVSRWQGIIDWQSVKKDNIQFAYIKASEGRTVVDPRFVSNILGARAAGVSVGAYHFARPDINTRAADALEEARNFIDTMQKGFGSRDFGDIYPVLDLEVPAAKKESALTTTELLSWADTFRTYFQRKTRRCLMLYTGSYFIKEHSNFNHPTPGNPLADMPLWIAMYPLVKGNPGFPQDIGSWTRWTVWQYSNLGKVSGISGNVDLNWAAPELLDLARF